MKIRLFTILVLAIFSYPSLAQMVPVTGTITNQENNLMPAVTVTLKGTNVATSTNAEGKFSINAPANGILVFTFVSYTTQELLINKRSVINVSLSPATGALDDVVIIGYGTQKKKDLTGSISSVTADDYKDQPVLNAAAALQGRVAGLGVSSPSGAPGKEAKIHIRGA
ncbi:MAG: carboxypeptidase-like regulatory domain-containing protein, partial [Ginsengibacter sp.]